MAEATPEVVIPNDLARMLAQVQTAKPLKSYTTVTHVGRSTALVLPDGDGNELTLYANSAGIDPSTGQDALTGLLVHGIAIGRPGLKLKIKVIGGEPVQFFHQSEKAKPMNRLICKNEHDVTRVHVGQDIVFTYDEKAPGWRQQ